MPALRTLPSLIFASRWLQLPLYLGLIVAQGIYVWLFWQELYYLLLAAFGNTTRSATCSMPSASKAWRAPTVSTRRSSCWSCWG